MDNINNIDTYKQARRQMLRDLCYDNYFSKCYLFSNENLSEYYKFFDIKDKDVLTVCGSGDQPLSYILNDVKNIGIFDTNPLAYYQYILKKMLIQSVNYEEFIKFYTIQDKNIDRYSIYEKVRDKINNEQIKKYWDKIFIDNKFCLIFLNKYFDKYMVERIPYLDNKNYYLLQQKLSDVTDYFKASDIFDISNNFDKYDFINLSNILDYINDKNKFINLINDLINNNLNQNGKILINYCWNYENNDNYELYNKLCTKMYPIKDICCSENVQKGKIYVYER